MLVSYTYRSDEPAVDDVLGSKRVAELVKTTPETKTFTFYTIVDLGTIIPKEDARVDSPDACEYSRPSFGNIFKHEFQIDGFRCQHIMIEFLLVGSYLTFDLCTCDTLCEYIVRFPCCRSCVQEDLKIGTRSPRDALGEIPPKFELHLSQRP